MSKKYKKHTLNNFINGDPFDEENLIDSLRVVMQLRDKNPKVIIEAHTKYWIATILRHPVRKKLAQRCDYIIDSTVWNGLTVKHVWKNENNKWTNITYEE